MTTNGIRLLSIGLIVLSTAFANAQDKLVNAADVTPPLAPPAPAPVIPKRPAEMMPKPPQVTCRGDQLTISADNSTLEAILASVKGCTGAHIDIPDGAGKVRAFEELGPGPVREVLDELLSGTQYNYVIQSSDVNPARVEAVMLSMRTTDDGKPATLSTDIPLTNGRRKWQLMQKFDKPDPSATAEENGADATDVPVAADSVATPAAQAAERNASASAADASSAEASATLAPPTQGISPVVAPNSSADPSQAVQDRISSMQQMFEQRQKMIEKQNQNQAAPPNN